MGLRDWLDTVFDNPDQTSADGGDGELSEGGDGGDGVTQDSHNTDSETISHASNPDSGMEVGRVSSEKHRNEMNSEGGFVFGESPIGPERKKEGPNTDDPDASPPEQEDVEAIDSETNSSSNQHPDATGEPTRAQLIEELQRLRREYGPTVIKSKYMNSRGEYSVNQYVEEFGSWEEALAAADIDKRAILLEDLATVWESIGRTPKTTDIDKYGDFSSGLYTVFFGSWSEAKDQCRQEHSVTSETSREETTTNSVSSDATTKHSRNTTSSRRSKLIQEIQRVEEQLGDRVVNSKNFRNESGYAFKEIIDEFGSWSDALDAAGIDRSEVILEEIARIWRDLGEQPTTTQMNEFSRLGSGLYSSEFESWSDAIEKCRSTHDVPDERPQTSSESEEQTAAPDLSDTGSDAPSRSELIAELQRINDKLDHLVKAPELPQHSEFSQADYETEFGSWDDALAAAGIDKKAVLLDELQRIWMKLGRRPKTSDMNNHGDYSAGMYSRAFGSWGEAISTVKERRQFDHDSKDSGEEPNSDRNHSDSSARSNGPDRSELVDELNRLHDQIGHKVINSRH